MTPIDAIILGILQGLTEFLPISSSGHIELGSALLNVQTANNLLFSVVVHAATCLSTVVIFRKDLLKLITDFFQLDKDAVYYLAALIISAIPVGIIGLTYDQEIENFFSGQLLLVGFMLLVTGLLLAMTYYAPPRTGKVTLGRALLIGLSQALAILPGISRSGATISTALLLGIDKEKAARFSFLMVLMPILGGSALKLADYLQAPEMSDHITTGVLLIGFLSAFVTGLLACKWMISIVKKGKLIYFAFYCFLVGSITILLSM
jgi:undecaprenyl-diphosphatase